MNICSNSWKKLSFFECCNAVLLTPHPQPVPKYEWKKWKQFFLPVLLLIAYFEYTLSILSHIFSYFLILSHTFSYFLILSYTSSYFLTLLHPFKAFYALSHTISLFPMLSQLFPYHINNPLPLSWNQSKTCLVKTFHFRFEFWSAQN